jgi:hypothetical protein
MKMYNYGRECCEMHSVTSVVITDGLRGCVLHTCSVLLFHHPSSYQPHLQSRGRWIISKIVDCMLIHIGIWVLLHCGQCYNTDKSRQAVWHS